MYHRFEENKYPSTNIRLDIFKKHISIEENLDVNCKSYWQYSNKDSDNSNKRNLSKYLKRIVEHSDEVFLIDRHVPRTICQSKTKHRKSKDINYANSYLNSFEFFNSVLKDNLSKNRFYCGLLSKEFEKFGSSTEELLKKADAMLKAVNEHATRERQMNKAIKNMDQLDN